MNKLFQKWSDAQEWRERIDVRTDNPFYTASFFLAVLAYPDNTDQRNQLVGAIQAALRPVWKLSPGMRKRDRERTLNRAARKIKVRYRASALMANIILEKVSTESMRFTAARSINEAVANEGIPITLSLPIDIISPAARSRLPRHRDQPRPGRPNSDDVDKHVISNVWSASKPVLHLAHALLDVRRSQPNFGDLFFGPEWAPKAIDKLPQIALTICATGKVKPSNLIMLRSL